MPDRKSPLAPFRNETFRLIWAASLISNFGGLIQSVGAAWMMASSSSSANMVALVQASTSLPIMLFSVAAGALADNFDRRKLMLTAQSFMLVVAVCLGWAVFEFVAGSPLWGMLFGALGVYAAVVFLRARPQQ